MFLTEVNLAFYGVTNDRYEATCARSSVAIYAEVTKIKADEYHVAIVVGWEVMKTVDSKTGGDFHGCADYYEKGKDIELPFWELFGKLADETLKKHPK